jgi:hypothetical protein
MQWLKSEPPFDSKAKQMELLRKLNEVPGVAISEDRMEGRPSIAISRLGEKAALDRFLDVLTWVFSEIRAS